jgi:phosphoserine phosphatase
LLSQSQELGVGSWFKKKGVETLLVSAATTEGVEELKRHLRSLVGK